MTNHFNKVLDLAFNNFECFDFQKKRFIYILKFLASN